MIAEGRLTIDLHRRDHSVARAEIASSRPLQAARVFEGKTPDELLTGLPLMFSVCAVAQGRAAVLATDQALGTVPDPAAEAARDGLVLAETAREHLLRIALDWPGVVGEEPVKSDLARVTRILPGFRAALFGEHPPFALAARALVDGSALRAALADLDGLIGDAVLGEPAGAFRERRTPRDFETWADTGRTCAARLVRKVMAEGWATAGGGPPCFLPDLDPAALAERLAGTDAVRFTARPEWDGAPRETTTLARRHANPLVAGLLKAFGTGLLSRLAARLVELAELPQEMRDRASRASRAAEAASDARPTRRDGEGLAQVEAARGRLVHAVCVENGVIARYRILAPTEWNFHPAGAVAEGLRCLAPADGTGLETQARLLIDAVDPCVGYELRVR